MTTTDTTQDVDLILQASGTLRDANVEVQRVTTREFTPAGHGTLVAGKPYPIRVILPRSAAPEGLIVTVTSPPLGYSHDFYCAIPLQRQPGTDQYDLTLVDTPLREAVNQLAAKMGRPVVMDASLTSTPVTAAVSGKPAATVWNAVLRPLHLRAVDTDGTYHLVGAS